MFRNFTVPCLAARRRPIGNDVGRINKVYSSSGLVRTDLVDRLRTGKPPRCAISHPGQLSLLPYTGWEMIRPTGQSVVMEVKADMVHSTCG